jgi:hypothetical protein
VMLKDLLRKRQKKKKNNRNSNNTSTTGFSNRAKYIFDFGRGANAIFFKIKY